MLVRRPALFPVYFSVLQLLGELPKFKNKYYLESTLSYREVSALLGISESVAFDCVQRIITILGLVSRKYIKQPIQAEIDNRERASIIHQVFQE